MPPACLQRFDTVGWASGRCGAGVVICLEQSAICIYDATANPSYLASLKARMVLPFWCQLTQVVLEKRPLNGTTYYTYGGGN